MFKPTPNPPDADPDPTAFDKAAKRALDFYLKPEPDTGPSPGQLFTVVNGVDTECLLANLSETLASADAMISDLAFELDGSRRWKKGTHLFTRNTPCESEETRFHRPELTERKGDVFIIRLANGLEVDNRAAVSPLAGDWGTSHRIVR